MQKEKALITGAGGFLAWNFACAVMNQFDLFGTVFKSRVESNSTIKTAVCDLRNLRETQRVLDEVKPKVVFHFAALSDPNTCQLEAKLSEDINFKATVQLAALCAERNIELIFTSTDLVFDGRKGNYSEQDEVNPISRYAEHKIMAEENLKTNPFAKICRMPLMYGSLPQANRSMFNDIKTKLENNEPVYLFIDEYRTATSAPCAVKGVLLAQMLDEKILHLGGPERMSRYEMGLKIAEYYGLPKSLIKASLQKDVKMPAARPPDVSLNSTKSFSKGFDPITLKNYMGKI